MPFTTSHVSLNGKKTVLPSASPKARRVAPFSPSIQRMGNVNGAPAIFCIVFPISLLTPSIVFNIYVNCTLFFTILLLQKLWCL